MPELAPKASCSGCTACFSICPQHCISMDADGNGFSYPVIEQAKCVDCNLCQSVCPVVTPRSPKTFKPVAYAAYSNDPAIRAASSSGGIFSEAAHVVLNQGGVVFGAAYDPDFTVRHISIENKDDLDLLRGAKYAQSYLGDTFQSIYQLLKNDRKVLFSGTPCQVAGLKAFLRKDYDNLLCIDFVCHGVPSPMAWSQYVRYRAGQDNDGTLPLAINLRSKETGWSGYQYSNVFEYANGTRNVCTGNDSLFMKLFVGDYISRVSCEHCAFKGYSRCSDLTLGDFWGIWDIAPDMDDNRGTSLVLVQSPKGKDIFKQINERCVVRKMSLEQASAQNQSMLSSSPSNAHRNEVLRTIKNGDFEKCTNLLIPIQTCFFKKIIRKLRLFK